RKGQVQQQVQRGDAEPDLEGGERGGDRLAAALGQFGDGDHRDQRGVLDQADELPGQRRQHALEGLRQDHVAHRLAGVQAQGAGGLVLSAGDGLHAGPDDLGHVGAGEQRQRRNPGELAGQVEHGADEEVEDEDLHQQRRAAHQLDVDRRQVVQGRVLRQPAEAGDQ
ncbi:hypothetical protein BCSJ1_25876, partial [Bacillus cereus SJ1]